MAYEYEQRMMKQRMEAKRNKYKPVNQADYPVRELKQDAKSKREEQNSKALQFDLQKDFLVIPETSQASATGYNYNPSEAAMSESKKYRSLADRIQPVVTSQQKSTGENLYDIYNQLIALGDSADWPVELPNPTSMYFDGFVDDYENLPDRMKSASAQKAVELYRQITPAKEAYDYASGLTGQVNNLYDQATMYEGLSEFYKIPEDVRNSIKDQYFSSSDSMERQEGQKEILLDYYKSTGLSDDEAKEKSDSVYEAYIRAKNQTSMEQTQEGFSKFQEEHPVLSNLASIPLEFMGGIASGAQALTDAIDSASGESAYRNRDTNMGGYQMSAASQVIRQQTKQDILGEDPNLFNKALSYLYGGTMSAVDNLLRIYSLGDVGSLAMAGFSSFGSGYQEAAQRGASPSEAFLYGGIEGALEIVTEKVSLDRFLNSPSRDSIKAIAKDALMQGLVEVSEEEASFWAGLLADTLIMGDKSEYNSNVATYMLEGKTEQEARSLASKQIVQDAWDTAVESLISGGIMSGAAGTKQYIGYANQGSKLSDTQRQALLTQANRLPGTESSQMYLRGGMDSRNAYFGALQGQVQQDISQRITGAETAEELFNLYREAIAETTPGVEAAADLAFMGRAQEMGQDVGDSAAAYATGAQIERQNRQSTGESWVDLILRRQYTADNAVERILNNESFRQEFAEKTGVEVPEVTLKGKNRSPQADINQAKRIVTNAIRNQEQRTQAYRDVYQKNEATAQEAAPEAQTGEAEERPLSSVSRENVTTPLPSPVSARISGGEESVEITGIKFRDGQMVAETSGGDFTLPELSISAGDKMGQVLNIAAGYGGNIARNFLSNYDGETDPKTYWDAYNAFLSAGKLAAGTETMTFERAAAVNDAYARVLPQRAQMEAFSVGRESARAEEQAVKATVKKARKGQGTVEDKTTKKTPEQDSIVKLLGAYAKRTGIDVTILDSIRNGDAKANGSFVATTMSMYLSSEADNVLQTLGHESGEFISAFAPEEKAAIRNTVLKWWAYHENLNAVDQLIRKYQEQYKKAEGSKTYNQAADEAINDALGALLTTETGQKQFVDWISKDNTMDAGKKKSLVQSIKNAVRKILDGLNEYLKRKGVSEETRRFLKMEVSQQEKIMKQFFHALDVAVENARETGEYVEESEASYSVDVSFDEDISKKAKNYFGKTYKWGETGYILKDGTKLDFSGRHEGGSGGYRTVDHREIINLFDEDTDISGTEAMVRFMQSGNIRISPEMAGINIAVQPTKAQYEVLYDFVLKNRGEVILDIDDSSGNTVVSVEYPKGTRANKVVEDIRRYFLDGTTPYVSETAKFRYSLSFEEESELLLSMGETEESREERWRSSFSEGAEVRTRYQMIEAESEAAMEELARTARGISTMEERLATQEALQRVSSATQDMVEYWRSQTKPHKGKTFQEASGKIARELKNSYQSQMNVNELSRGLQEIYNTLYSKGYEAAVEKAVELSKKLISKSIDTSGSLYEDYADARKYFRDKTVTISAEDAHDIPDFRDFQKRNFGHLKIGISYNRQQATIDGDFAEMAEMMPGFLDTSNTLAASDKLLAVAEALDAIYADRGVNPYEGSISETVNESALDMIQRVTGEFAEETFADKQAKALQDAVTEAKTEAQTEIQRLRDEAKRASLEAENTIAQLRNSVRAERMGANTYLEQAKASKAGLEAAEQTVEQLRKQLKDTQERLQKANGTPEERDEKRLADEMFYGRKARKGAVQEMERQKNRFAREQQRLQEAHRKAMDKELKRHETKLKNAEERLQRAKDKLEKYRGDRDERDAKIRLRASVERRVKRLTDKIVKNDTKTYMPEVFKKDIGEFLMSLDFTSSSFNKKGELTERDRRYTNSLEKLNYTIMNLSREGADTDGILLHIPDEFSKEIEKHIEKVRESTKDIDLGTSQVYAMTSQQLKKLDEILATLENAVNRSNELIGNARFKRVNEMSGSDIRSMDRLGSDKVRGKTRGRTSSFLRWEMATPSTAFRRFGEGGSSIMDEYVDGQAKVAFMDKEVMDFSQKTFTDKEKDSWRKKTRTYTLESGKKVQLTDAMVMTLYESEKRVHAQGHLYGGGIVVAPDENIKVSQKRPFLLTEKDVSEICKTVKSDPRQKRVADAIQHFMASTGAKWGNEFTMQVYGKNSFTEEDYFPIESSGDYIKRSEDASLSKRSDFARILHISATKGLTEGANNPIMIRDIFTVFEDHISDMMAMNAFGVPVLDTIKWFNYQERAKLETGQLDMKSIRASMESAYGEDAVKYVESFLKDVNGTEKAGRGEDFFSKWASKYKIASVGFNARVGLLQISAFPRAALEVEARYLRNGVKLLANFKDGKFHGIRENAFRAAADEMLKYSGIALYKDLGFREINIGPSERKMLTDVDPTSRIDFYKKRFFTKEGISENAMWLAEKMDKFTWSAIWMACKAKTAAETNLRGEALLKETAKFFDRLCVKTQVFDSPITKSQIMRSKSGLVKSVTSFMAEPITSYNAVLRSYDQISEAKRLGKKLPIKNFVSAVSACSASMLFGAILESIMDVPRDDDDYETKWEKFLQALVGDGSLEGFFLDSNLGSGMNPLNYIPYARDAVSALSGYENSDMTTAWMYESVKALKEIAEIWRVKNGFQEDYTKITYYGKKTEYGVIYDSLKALSHATGAPLSNLSRDLISMWNATIGTAHPDLKVKTYEPSQETAIQEAFEAGYLTREEALEKLQEKVTDKDGNAISQDDAYWKLRSWETGSSSKLHTLTGALIAGEPEGIQEAKQELLAHGYETGDMDSVFTKAIGEAYKKDADGNYGNGRISRKQAEKYLLSYTGKNEKEVYKTLQEWDYAIENEGTDGFSVYNDLHSAIEAGGNLDKEKQALVSGGYSEKDINSEVKSYIGKLYKNGDFFKSDAQKLLGEYLGIDDEKELYDTFREWDYAAENGSGDGFSLYMDVDAAVEAGKPIDSIIRELTAHGYKESDIRSEAVSYVGKLFLDGKISETKAGQLYVKYASLDEDGNKPDENDVYWKLKEWKYKKANPDAEGYSRFDSLFTAVDNGANLSASIQEYLEHGYESKDLSSQITREYKKQFVKLWNSNRGQAEKLMDKLLDAYEALGYSRSKKREDILDWLEES